MDRKIYFSFARNNLNKISLSLFNIQFKSLLIIFLVNSFFISYEESEINLVIEGSGSKNFVNEEYYLAPSQVIINATKTLVNVKKSDLDGDLNNITLKFGGEIKSCLNMFKGLTSIKEIDLSKLDTSLITDMTLMFCDCINLEKVTFGNKTISSITSMDCMFKNCINLTVIDLSIFDTSLVTIMKETFCHCQSLQSIDVSKFNTSNVENMYDMFAYCYNLISVDVSNFNTSKAKNMRGMFYQCYSLKYINLSNINTSLVTTFQSTFAQTESAEIINLYSFKIKNDANYDATFFGSHAKICINDIPSHKIFESYEKKNDCSDICLNKNLKINLKYNTCVEYCNESEYKYEYNNYCYEKCPNSTKESNDTKYLCIYEVNNDNNFEQLETVREHSEDFANDDNGIILEDKYIIILRELIANSDIIDNITKSKSDYIQKINNVTYQITTSDNQRNNQNYTISSIELGEDCEKTLRYKYGINQSFPLIIFKIDYKSSDTLIPIIGYEIYNPINKTKLDLSECKDIKLNIPVSIDENNLFKYNPNSDFYTDDCSSYTTENGTDIILNDRKQEFKDKNLSLCQNNCTYIDYNKKYEQSSCQCIIKNNMDFISQIMANPNKLSNDFENEEKGSNNLPSNIQTMKFTKTLFSKEGIISNISSYILFIIISHFLLSIILFMKCGYHFLEEEISKILSEKKKEGSKSKNSSKRLQFDPPKNQKIIKKISSKIQIFLFQQIILIKRRRKQKKIRKRR